MSAIDETFKAIMDRLEEEVKAAKTRRAESQGCCQRTVWNGFIDGIRKAEAIIAAERAMLPEKMRNPETETGNEVRKPETGSWLYCQVCGTKWLDTPDTYQCPDCMGYGVPTSPPTAS